MTNLLLRDIDPALKRKLEERARAHGRSVSEEIKALIERGIADEPRVAAMGTRLLGMLPDKWRGDDLVFGLPEDLPEPAEFEQRAIPPTSPSLSLT
jgi:plasmid stability protein